MTHLPIYAHRCHGTADLVTPPEVLNYRTGLLESTLHLDLPQVSRDVLSQLTGFGSLSLFLHPLCLSNCTAHRCRHNNSSYSRFLHRIIAMSLYTVLVPYDIEQNVARGIVRKFLTLLLSTLNHCTVVIHCVTHIATTIWLAARDLYRLH